MRTLSPNSFKLLILCEIGVSGFNEFSNSIVNGRFIISLIPAVEN